MSLMEKVKAGKFLILGELQPPKGADFQPMLDAARLVKGRVDALVVPDQPVAVMKASSLGACLFLQSNGFDTVMQISPRDRNRLALQADLLSASAIGVENILLHQGEDVTHGDHHLAREVRDLDLPALFDAVNILCGGKDLAGIALTGAPSFFPGVEMTTGAGDGFLDSELERLKMFIEKGARFMVTSPVFDLRRFAGLIDRIDRTRIAVIPQVLVLKSAGMARYVDRNVRNISIPQEMIRRLEKAPDRERIGVRIAGETIAGLRDLGLAGAVVLTRGWEKRLPQILDNAGIQ